MGCRLEPTPTRCRSLESIQFINHSHRSPFLGQYNNGRGSSAGGLPYWIHDSSQWEMLAAIDYSDRRNATHGRHLAGSRCPQEGSTRPSLLSIIHQIQSNPIQSNQTDWSVRFLRSTGNPQPANVKWNLEKSVSRREGTGGGVNRTSDTTVDWRWTMRSLSDWFHGMETDGRHGRRRRHPRPINETPRRNSIKIQSGDTGTKAARTITRNNNNNNNKIVFLDHVAIEFQSSSFHQSRETIICHNNINNSSSSSSSNNSNSNSNNQIKSHFYSYFNYIRG